MLPSTGPGAISRLTPMKKTYYSKGGHETHTPTIPGGQYDSVSLSAQPTGAGQFHRALVSRLSQEIRTATTTGDIQSLRREVLAGEYQPDPSAIAARMLLMAEDA